MRLSAEDVRTPPEAPEEPPQSRSWRLELVVALVGLLAGLALAIWLLA